MCVKGIFCSYILVIYLAGVDWEPEEREEFCVRVWCPELLQEGQWHHLVIVLNRAVLKNSSVSVYVDGQHHSTQKVSYVVFHFYHGLLSTD